MRKPPWLKVPPPWGRNFAATDKILKEYGLETVCRNANCPNIGECYSSGTATFLIMGPVCTRNCRFCNIEHATPREIDPMEPLKVAEAVKKMLLKYAVVTSVTRDDIPDGGASHFAATIREIRRLNPGCKVEVLVPDFRGDVKSVKTVLDAEPDVFNHNVETVRRLYPSLRPEADYDRSLNILAYSREIKPDIPTKSGIMVGAGEKFNEIVQLFRDVERIGVSILTIGQYLPPSLGHHPLDRYYTPDEFRQLKNEAEEIGIANVISAPLVRSSYEAHRLFLNKD